MVDKSTSHWPITVTNGIAAFFSIGLPLALVRIVSPDDVGRYNIFFLYVMLTSGIFLTGGLNNGLYHWAGKTPEAKPELKQSWTLIMMVTTAACLLGLLFNHWIVPWLKLPLVDYKLLLLSMPFNLGASFLEDLMIARGRIWMGSWYGSGSNIFRTALLLGAASWTHNMEVVFWIFFLGAILRFLMGLFLLRGNPELHFIFSKEKMRSVLRYALPVSVAGTAALALHYVDRMLLSFRLTPAHFAFYSAGCLIVPPLEILAISVNRVLIPKISQALSVESPQRAAAMYSSSVAELFRILLPATVGLILYSHPIIDILFTSRYESSARYLNFYALNYLFMALPYDAIARARGDGGWIFRISVSFALLSVAAAWFASGHWGAMGTLLSMLAVQLIMRVYSISYGKKVLALSITDLIPLKEMGIQLFLVAFLALFVLGTRHWFVSEGLWFLVTGPIFTALYFAITYVLFRSRSVLPITAGKPLAVMELTQTLCFGGLERTVSSLAQELKKDETVSVIVGVYEHPVSQLSLARTLKKTGVEVIEWNKGKSYSLSSVSYLVTLLRTHEISVLHVHDLGPLVYGCLAKLKTHRPFRLVSTIHTLKYILESRKHRLYYRIFLTFADTIVAVSQEVKEGLTSIGIRAEKIQVIANGVEFPSGPVDKTDSRMTLRRSLLPKGTEDDYASFWVLCLARLHPGKGQETLLSIWSTLPDNVRRSSLLLFVGQETQDAYRDHLTHIASKGPDRPRIRFIGPSESPMNWVQSCDVFVSGSELEGRPLAPLEAVGAGVPVLLSNIEGHRFLKPWGRFFNLDVPADGSKQLADLFQNLFPFDEGARQVRWNATAVVRQQWGMNNMTREYRNTFQNVVLSSSH